MEGQAELGHPPAAWAFWPRWGGATGLLAHVARTGRRAVLEHLGGESTCEIEVRVPLREGGYDDERFDSPEEFAAGVTTDALRRFDSIRIAVEHRRLEVHVVFARAEGAGPAWLERGVVLQVRGRDGAVPAEAVTAVRDRLTLALNRGLPRFRASVTTGEGEAPPPPDVVERHSKEWLEEDRARLARLVAEMARAAGSERRSWRRRGPKRTERLRRTTPRTLSADDLRDRPYLREHPSLVSAPDYVQEFLAHQRPEWLAARWDFVRPWRGIADSATTLLPILFAVIGGLASGAWELTAFVAVSMLAAWLLLAPSVLPRVRYRVELTDVSPGRRVLSRALVWLLGPGVGLLTFSLGRLTE